MDVLVKGVIKPLEMLIVSYKNLVWVGVPVSITESALRKQSKAGTRDRIKRDLKASAAQYADHVENTISPLQQAYLKRYHPEQYSRSSDVSHHPVDIRDKGIGGKVSPVFHVRGETEPARGDWRSEGITDITQGQLQLSLLNWLFGLASEDNFRMGVSQLNMVRSMRVDILGDGFDVSDVPWTVLRYHVKHFQCSVLKSSFSRLPSRTSL